MRLIDAKELEWQVKAVFKDNNPVLMGQMLRWIRKQKTVDAVPVVRCKDCVNYHNNVCPLRAWEYTKPDDFCSYGERRFDD